MKRRTMTTFDLLITTVCLCVLCGEDVSAQTETKPPSADQLDQLLKSEDPGVRLAAVDALARAGPDSSDFVPRLWEMVRSDASSEVRKHAIHSIVEINGADQVDLELFLQSLRNDEDLDVRRAAAHAIGSVGRADDEVVAALNELADDLADDADFSNEIQQWVWRIGWAVIVGILAVVAIGAIRYFVFRDLRRTLITASLALAFLPQIGVTILTLFVEYCLYGEDRSPGVVTIVGAITSATVIVFAMFFIDRQDARRQPRQEDNEWSILSDAVEKFCGLPLTPKGYISHLVSHFSVPDAFTQIEGIDAAVRDTLWEIIDKQLSQEDAIAHLSSLVAPHPLKRHQAIYLLTISKHYVRGVQRSLA